MLDIETRTELEKLLRGAWNRSVAEGRSGEYDEAAQQLVQELITNVRDRRAQGEPVIRRSAGPQASLDFLSNEEFRAAFGPLCPGFWPFC